MFNPNEYTTPPRTIFEKKNNTDMMSYAAIFTQDTTPYDLNKNLPPKSSLKRNFIVSYDINATHDFPNIYNTQKKLKQKTNTRTREVMGNTIDTSTLTPTHSEDTISTLFVENNKTKQANVTNRISDNNKSNKLTFLQML